MADKDKTTTIIQAGAKGGVSAVMPYVAIGVLGYLGLKQLKNLDIGVGGVAGSIIDSVSDAADDAVSYVTNVAGDTVLFITDGVKNVEDAAKEFVPPITGYEEKRPIGVAGLKATKATMDIPSQKLSTYTVFGYEDVSRIGVVPPKETFGEKVVIAPGEAARVRSTYGTVYRSGTPKPTRKATKTTADWKEPSHGQRPEHLYPKTEPKKSKTVTSKTGFTLHGDIKGRPY